MFLANVFRLNRPKDAKRCVSKVEDEENGKKNDDVEMAAPGRFSARTNW